MTGKQYNDRHGLSYRHLRPTNERIVWDDREKGAPWQSRARFDPHHDLLTSYGRCKSGQRWFWACHTGAWKINEDDINSHGWADDEQAAFAAVYEAILSVAEQHRAHRIVASYSAHFASYTLRELNRAKRAARPQSDTTDAKSIEYLYGHTMGGEDSPGSVVRFQITKKTAKRIFYSRACETINEHGELTEHQFHRYEDETGYVDRQKLEANGEVYNRSKGWWDAEYHLHASLEGALGTRHRSKPTIDLHQLKAAMAAAHPDKGGTNEAFVAARKAYVAARRAVR
jgi:hypothetical protein